MKSTAGLVWLLKKINESCAVLVISTSMVGHFQQCCEAYLLCIWDFKTEFWASKQFQIVHYLITNGIDSEADLSQ